MALKKSQPDETANEYLSSASMGPLKNMDAPYPQEKRTPTKSTKKLAVYRTPANCHSPYEAV
jgi:hypothetical protein